MREWLTAVLGLGRSHTPSSDRTSLNYTAFEAAQNTRDGKNRNDQPQDLDNQINYIQSKRKKKTIKYILRICFTPLNSGLLALCIAILTWVFEPYECLKTYNLKLLDGSLTFLMWRTPPAEVLLKVYIFNITNADAFLAGRESLHVEQLGPYVYHEKLDHGNITFNTNGTLSGVPVHPLVWLPDRSNGTEQDMITVPNVAYLTAAEIMRDLPFFASLGMNVLINQLDSQPIVRTTVRDYIFEYYDPLVEMGNKFLPNWINFKTIGLVERMYNFANNTFTVFSGETDVKYSGLFDTYNGLTDLPQWEGTHCSNVTGSSDSTKYQSSIEPGEKLYFFRKSVCRKMTLVQNGTITLGGLTGNSYFFEENALDNGKYIPENSCYCRKGRCLPEGLIDARDCYYGFPIVLSYPHFYQADPALLEKVRGLNPIREEHQSYYHVMPDIGLAIRVASRFQTNLELGNLWKTSRARSFSNMVVPIFWVDIGMADLPMILTIYFFFSIHILPKIFTGVFYLSLLAGTSLLMYSLLRWYQWVLAGVRRRRRPTASRLGHRAQHVRASKFLDQPPPPPAPPPQDGDDATWLPNCARPFDDDRLQTSAV